MNICTACLYSLKKVPKNQLDDHRGMTIVLMASRLQTPDELENTLAVNYLGPFLLTIFDPCVHIVTVSVLQPLDSYFFMIG